MFYSIRRTFSLSMLAMAAFGLLLTAGQVSAQQFVLQGTDGFGLLPGNENPAATGGTGGLTAGGQGIFFDSDTNMLTIDVSWGSLRGFSDLTGDVTVMHIHQGSTNGTATTFDDSGAPFINLHTGGAGIFDGSANNGFYTNTFLFNDADRIDALNAGELYINVHTSANTGGEIRGNIVAASVPEPGSLALLGLSGAAIAMVRRRRIR